MKVKRDRKPAAESTLLAIDAFAAYAQRKAIETKISALQRESKALREIIESEFRTNQVRLASADGSLQLVKETRTVGPFTNPGYSYHVFTLQQTK